MDEGSFDAQKRREQRRDLRKIIQDVQKHRDELAMPDDLVHHIHSINDVFRGVVSTREAAIDAEGFLLLSNIGKTQAEAHAGELVFDPTVFAEKLVTFMGGRRHGHGGGDGAEGGGGGGARASLGALNWAKLGERAMSCFKTPPTLAFLNGALDLDPIVRKQRQRGVSKKKSSSEMTAAKPKELANFEDEEESTTKEVVHMMKHLRVACGGASGGGCVHYFSFLIDPDSFSRSVENLFHFAFLVKDGRVGILIKKDGQPYIHLSDSSEQSQKQSKNQAIISISFAQWKSAIEKFSISSAAIPPRKE